LRLISIVLLFLMSGAASAEIKYFPDRQPLCLDCHGRKGVSPTPMTPSLGGVPEYYALLQLVEFRDGDRRSEIMRAMVRDMTDDDLRAAASFVGRQPRAQGTLKPGDPVRMRRGGELADKHRCNQCHGSRFLGGRQMPPLRNQREDYLLKALRDYKTERRLGDRAAMVEIVSPLSDKDLGDLAHYLAHVRN